jgi:hypothetical protein
MLAAGRTGSVTVSTGPGIVEVSAHAEDYP